MQLDLDGRVHTSYGFVSTWRNQSSESPFGNGGNLQNIPSKGEEGTLVRSLFAADEGKEMCKCDLGQAEARVVAWEARDVQRIQFYLDGRDVHWENARMLFGIPESESQIPAA